MSSDGTRRAAGPSGSEPGEKVPAGFARGKRGTESPSRMAELEKLREQIQNVE